MSGNGESGGQRCDIGEDLQPVRKAPPPSTPSWPEEPPLLPLQKFGERSRQRVFGGRAAANTPVWRRHDPSPARLFI